MANAIQFVQTLATITTTTSSGLYALTFDSTIVQVLTGTSTGFVVQLPSGTSLDVGQQFQIYNASTQTVVVNDDSGGSVATLTAGQIAFFYLDANLTTAGVWLVWQNTAGGSSFDVDKILTNNKGEVLVNHDGNVLREA